MRRPTILVTRPDPDGAATAKALAKTTGLHVVQSPLVDIAPTGPLPDLGTVSRLIFTSRNGVRTYEALGGPPMPAICVGEATAEAAAETGMKTETMGGDAEGMIAAILKARPAGPLLHLRGEVVRTDVAGRLTAGGVETREAVIYRQTLLDLSEEARALLSDRRPVILPLYSARTAARLAELIRPRAPLHLVAMSTAVARAAASLEAENRVIADAPDAPSMIRAVLATLRRVEGRDHPN